MLAGQGVDAFYTSVEHAHMTSIGLNCATGPEFMTDHVRTLAGMANCFASVYPNGGLPDELGQYSETPEMMAETLGRFAEQGWLNLVGGCCGTTPEFIRRIAAAARAHKPPPPPTAPPRSPRRRPPSRHIPHGSAIEYVECEDSSRPLIIGERTNVIGSRKFKRLIVYKKWEEAAAAARGHAA